MDANAMRCEAALQRSLPDEALSSRADFGREFEPIALPNGRDPPIT